MLVKLWKQTYQKYKIHIWWISCDWTYETNWGIDDIAGHNILAIYCGPVRVWFNTSKTGGTLYISNDGIIKFNGILKVFLT